MTKKYICHHCNYATDKLFNYNKHTKTKKHTTALRKVATSKIDAATSKIEAATSICEGNPSIFEGKPSKNDVARNRIICKFCKKEFSERYNRDRHYRTCKYKIIHEIEDDKDVIITELRVKNEEQSKELEKAIQIKEEATKELEDLEHKYIELLQKVADNSLDKKTINNCNTINSITNNSNNTINNKTNSNTNNSNNKTTNKNAINMYYVINNFKDAPNYIDKMSSPLTDIELEHILNDPSTGCVKLITDRCIKGVDLKNRPFHCTDNARTTFVLRENNKWIIDNNATKMMNTAFDKVDEAVDLKPNYNNSNVDVYEHTNSMMKLFDMRTKNKNKIIRDIKINSLLKNNV